MTTYRNFRHLQPDEAYSTFFDDFQKYVATEWTLTTTEAGAGSATEAITSAEPNGVLLITNDAADDDNDFFQWPNETFQIIVGKKLSFKARFKVSDATQCDFVMGLQITDTTPLAVTDGIYFRKDDGDAFLDFVVIKNSTASTLTACHTVVANTYFLVEFYYDGTSDDIDAFINGTRVGSLPLTNIPDDEVLTVSFGIQNGEAFAKTVSVDYILVLQQR